MSLFGDLDVAAAADDPFSIENGTYEATVSKVEVKDSANGEKRGLFITYTVTDEDSPMLGRSVSEWKTIPKVNNPANITSEEARDLSFLKMRLSSLGVPESAMNSVQEDDLIGIDVIITVKRNNEYTNVTRVSPVGSVIDNPFA